MKNLYIFISFFFLSWHVTAQYRFKVYHVSKTNTERIYVKIIPADENASINFDSLVVLEGELHATTPLNREQPEDSAYYTYVEIPKIIRPTDIRIIFRREHGFTVFDRKITITRKHRLNTLFPVLAIKEEYF